MHKNIIQLEILFIYFQEVIIIPWAKVHIPYVYCYILQKDSGRKQRTGEVSVIAYTAEETYTFILH